MTDVGTTIVGFEVLEAEGIVKLHFYFGVKKDDGMTYNVTVEQSSNTTEVVRDYVALINDNVRCEPDCIDVAGGDIFRFECSTTKHLGNNGSSFWTVLSSSR